MFRTIMHVGVAICLEIFMDSKKLPLIQIHETLGEQFLAGFIHDFRGLNQRCFQHLKRESSSRRALYPSSVSDVLSWGFFNSHLSNLEMNGIFPEVGDRVLKCEWGSIFGSVSAFWWIFLLLNFLWSSQCYDHSSQRLLEKVKHFLSFFHDLCGLFWPLYITFPLLKRPWQSTNSFVELDTSKTLNNGSIPTVWSNHPVFNPSYSKLLVCK